MIDMTRMKIELPFRNSKQCLGPVNLQLRAKVLQIHIFNPVSENVWAVHNIKCIYTYTDIHEQTFT